MEDNGGGAGRMCPSLSGLKLRDGRGLTAKADPAQTEFFYTLLLPLPLLPVELKIHSSFSLSVNFNLSSVKAH